MRIPLFFFGKTYNVLQDETSLFVVNIPQTELF